MKGLRKLWNELVHWWCQEEPPRRSSFVFRALERKLERKTMGKFLVGCRVRSKANPRLVGTVVDNGDAVGMVRFKLDVPTQRGDAAWWEYVTLPEGDVENAPSGRKFTVGERVVWICAPSGRAAGTVWQVNHDDGYGVQLDNGWYTRLYEAALVPEHVVKVGQRVLLVDSPRLESKFVINKYGTVLNAELGGVFEVKLDNGARVFCDRSMVRFLPDLKAPERKFKVGDRVCYVADKTAIGVVVESHGDGMYGIAWNGSAFKPERMHAYSLELAPAVSPLLDETFFLSSYASESVQGGTAYDVKLCGLANTPSVFGGGDLKLRLASMDGWDKPGQPRYFRVTVTPIEEAKLEPLPCPFCQSNPVDDGQTLMCKACGRAATYEPTKEARVAAWNRRAK
jgi:hypothetical protein